MKINLFTTLNIIVFLFISACSQNTNSHSSDVWVGEPDSGFRNLKAVNANHYMVASGSKTASEAGTEIIAKGGNAIDAAIATALVLNVVEPHSSGIGGGGFLVYYDKESNQTISFNGRETAPEKSHDRIFLDKDGYPRNFQDAVRGGLSVGTPGLLKMMKEAHNQYGKLPWEDLFQPAIKAANNGFKVSERFNLLSQEISYLKNFGETSEIYLDKNKNPRKVGELITNPTLAKTLTTISKNGIKSFYEGNIAQNIVHAVQNSAINPGYLSLADLKNYDVKKGDLICTPYRNHKICTMSLPSGGPVLLQIMSILENFELNKLKPNSLAAVHLITEATRLAYADRNEYMADESAVPLKKLLSKNYLRTRAALIKTNQALTSVKPGKFTINQNFVLNKRAIEPPSTTHLSVIDKSGNAVSMTNSIEYFFGSAISVNGFLLNNQLTDFSFLPSQNGKKVANRLRPKSQPRSSMSPTLVFDNKGQLVMILGSPGGPRIIQFVAKAIINHIDFGLDVQEAISLPTFVVLNDVIELEKNRNITKLNDALKEMGHKTKIIEIVSGIQAITLKDGKIQGGADPRREGVAIGF